MSNLATNFHRSINLNEPKLTVFPQKKISEDQYWAKYYEAETSYEWNNGYLEEKRVSDYATTLIYKWFVQLLDQYFNTHNNGAYTYLEMGFRMNLGQSKVSIRKPDLGVFMTTNPKQLLPEDRTYHGIFDLCIEALSDSTTKECERDTKIKKQEYAYAGVKEYYILHGKSFAFYQLKQGIYEPINRSKGNVIQSEVLPEFQFRVDDLHDLPSTKTMSLNPVYQDFVFLDYQFEKKRADAAEQEIIRLKKQLDDYKK